MYQALVEKVNEEAQLRLERVWEAQLKLGKWQRILSSLLKPGFLTENFFSSWIQVCEGKASIEALIAKFIPQEISDVLENQGLKHPSLRDVGTEFIKWRISCFRQKKEILLSAFREQIWAEWQLEEAVKSMDAMETPRFAYANISIQKERADREVLQLTSSDAVYQLNEAFCALLIFTNLVTSEFSPEELRQLIFSYVPFQQYYEKNLEERAKLVATSKLKLALDKADSFAEISRLIAHNEAKLTYVEWVGLIEVSELSTAYKEKAIELLNTYL